VTDQITERPKPGSMLTATASPVLTAKVMARALFRLRPADLPALRKRPGPVPESSARVPPSLLRYADEQTVAGTSAVFTAIAAMGADPGQFETWGVVAATRYLGRANLAVALRTFLAEGVWGTSPHLIPHFALHSASGSISLALGSHGPNLGVGGGLHAISEGFLTALTWLSNGAVPGVWLVLSGWAPELIPDPAGHPPSAGECLALALALVRACDEAGGATVRAVFESSRETGAEPPTDLMSLAELMNTGGDPLHETIALDASGRLRIELVDQAD
jgi:hypothetical protein